MGMVVRTNTMSTNAYRQLSSNNTTLAKSLEKLSSGFRINRAGDDASGLAISEKMKAQIKGLEQSSANAQDGISLVQTAEGALTEVHSMLNRMVELATKSANGTVQTEVDREAIQTEVDALNTEISRIAKSTNFNGINLLDGSLGSSAAGTTAVDVKYDNLIAKPTALALQAATKNTIGVAAGTANALSTTAETTLSIQFEDADGNLQNKDVKFTAANADITNAANQSVLKTALEDAFGNGYTIGVTAGAISIVSNTAGAADKTEIFNIDLKDATGAAIANDFGAVTNTAGADAYYNLDTTVIDGYTGATTENASDYIFEVNGEKFAFANAAGATKMGTYDSSVNVITVADAAAVTAAEVTSMTTLINNKTGISATNSATTTISLKAGTTNASNVGGLTLQVGDSNDKFNKVTVVVDDLTAKGLGISNLDVSTQETAGKSLSTIKEAINKVSTNRGNLGALQNRLEHAISNLDTTAENMDAANSRIRDTDMAKEMMQYTKMNILSQAAQAMLAQANQAPQSILQLLQ